MRRMLKKLQVLLPHETGFKAADNPYTESEFLKICEDYRVPNDPMRYRGAYAYLILSSQASARSSIVGNMVSSFTAQSAFLNNFEDIVNRRVNIQEDINCYQDTLSYTSSKVDYSIGENLFMLPSNMKLKIKTGTVRYNNKILVSNGNFSLGKNENVNSLETPVMKSRKDSNFVAQTSVTCRDLEKTAATHRNLE